MKTRRRSRKNRVTVTQAHIDLAVSEYQTRKEHEQNPVRCPIRIALNELGFNVYVETGYIESLTTKNIIKLRPHVVEQQRHFNRWCHALREGFDNTPRLLKMMSPFTFRLSPESTKSLKGGTS